MISYSQNFEDILLYRVFREKKEGLYVDVGAFDPMIDSVTKHFYDLGWNGINIEPAKEQFLKFVEERPKDINLNIAISNKEGELELLVPLMGKGCASLSENNIEELKETETGKTITENILREKVKVQTLNQVLEIHARNKTIDFLKIDVEGLEKQVLEGLDLQTYKPTILLIEATKPCTQIPSHDEWEYLVLNADYKFVYFDGLNRWYIHQTNFDLLKKHFDIPVNVFDDYIKFSLNEHNLKEQNYNLELENNNLKEQNYNLELENNNLKEQNYNLSSQLHSLSNSVSWKITEPLRHIRTKLASIKRKLFNTQIPLEISQIEMVQEVNLTEKFKQLDQSLKILNELKNKQNNGVKPSKKKLNFDRISILFDLRVCQFWRERGIPVYMQSLVLNLAKKNPLWNIYILLDETFEMPTRINELTESCKIVYCNGDDNIDIDFYLIACAFTDFSKDLDYKLLRYDTKLLTISWDCIPQIFPEQYLPSEESKARYEYSTKILSLSDHIFAISKSAKEDTEELFNIDCRKVSCIYGGIDETFWFNQQNKNEILEAENHFVYTGGGDPRKNLEGTIKAFSQFTHLQAKSNTTEIKVQKLYIVWSIAEERKQSLYQYAENLGLKREQNIIITGYVTNERLKELVVNAKAMIFPSLYEGLGLPILESYACKTPVIASNNSSIKELVHPDCLFNASDTQSIALKMLDFCENYSALKEKSLTFAKDILEMCNWNTVCDKFREVLEKNFSNENIENTENDTEDKPLALFSSLPPDESGVSIYTAKAFKNSPWTNHYFSSFSNIKDFEQAKEEILNNDSKQFVFSNDSFVYTNYLFDYDKLLFVFGNSEHHLNTLDSWNCLQNHSKDKYIYLHEANILSLWFMYFKANFDELKKFLCLHYPERSKEIKKESDLLRIFTDLKIGGIRPLLAKQRGQVQLIVNSQNTIQLIENELKQNSLEELPIIHVLFNPIFELEKPTIQKESKNIIIGSFGMLGKQKHPDIIFQACNILIKEMSSYLSEQIKKIQEKYSLKSFQNKLSSILNVQTYRK